MTAPLAGTELKMVALAFGAIGVASTPVDATNPLPVTVAAGTATGTEYTEDAASIGDPVGPMLMARRRDVLVTNEVSATGDNIALNATNKGELHTRNMALEAVLPAALAASGGLKIEGVAGGVAAPIVGNLARAVAVAGAPVLVGGRGKAGPPTAVAADQVVEPWLSLNGASVIAVSSDVVADTVTPYCGLAYDLGGSAFPVGAQNFVHDGTSRYYWRGNTKGGFVVPKPDTTGGLTPSRIVTGTSGVVKASAGQVYEITAYNVSASVRYLHLYNKTTAPTLSTDTPVITIPLLGASIQQINLTDLGAAFATGIAWAYTTDDIAIPTAAGTSTELHATILYN